MKKYALNDIAYNFKPLEIFQPDPDYKVDEKELQESIKKKQGINCPHSQQELYNKIGYSYEQRDRDAVN